MNKIITQVMAGVLGVFCTIWAATVIGASLIGAWKLLRWLAGL